ncbi:MAG: carboxylesterase/lipase family protein [Bacteroidia bacterium]|nr:carboxylesterase/lipase family protein [Bacteroidia bacterium]
MNLQQFSRALFSFALLTLIFFSVRAQKPVISTTFGKVRGQFIENTGVYRFADVPFARAPQGDLRWMPPQAPVPWDTVYDATEFGNAAVQYARFSKDTRKTPTPHSEDCLRLNLWAPDTVAGAKKAVLVYVHGGAWILGSGRSYWSNGAEFAKNGDIIFVNLQYRLGPLGWLDLEDFGGAEYANSKNLGLLDLVKGLEWVRDNIAQFGGDPNNVTLMGQSAGSGNVMALALMPEALGLFHKLIAESGTYGFSPTPAEAKHVAEDFIRLSGAQTMEDLKKLSEDEIVALYKEVAKANKKSSGVFFGPIYDGGLLPSDPYAQIEAGQMAPVPLLNGTTEDEINMWVELIPVLRKIPGIAGRLIVKQLGSDWGDLAPLRKLIREENPDFKKVFVLSRLVTLMIFREPHQRVSQAWLKHEPVYSFRFDWPSPNSDLKAYHAMELPFIFNHRDHTAIVGENPPGQLFDALHYAWIQFAKTGNPNHDKLGVTWPQYSPDQEETLIFDEVMRVENQPEKADLDEWNRVRVK